MFSPLRGAIVAEGRVGDSITGQEAGTRTILPSETFVFQLV